MKLIADSGSTKTDWCLVNDDRSCTYFATEGYNPFFVDAPYITNSLRNNFPQGVDPESVCQIYFYGAGCLDLKNDIVKAGLQSYFTKADISVQVDLLGAARGLLGEKSGFAAILGTGTNTGLYDGTSIGKQVNSLGFLLGDEGSGSAIGKKILADFIRGKMPDKTLALFSTIYQKSPDQIMNEVYASPLPNRYCANYTRFLKHPEMDTDYSNNLVSGAFQSFFINLVSAYPDYNQYTFNSVGSVGYHFADLLRQTASAFDMPTGVIISSPMDHLVAFHLTSGEVDE